MPPEIDVDGVAGLAATDAGKISWAALEDNCAPEVTAVDAVLNHGAGLEETIEVLLARPMKGEN